MMKEDGVLNEEAGDLPDSEIFKTFSITRVLDAIF